MWTITRRGRDGSDTAPERTRLGPTAPGVRSATRTDPVAREPDPVLRRGGEVELAAAGERPAVHDRHAHGPPAWRSVTFAPHGSVLFATPRCPASACRRAEPAAVQAGPVPRRLRAAEEFSRPTCSRAAPAGRAPWRCPGHAGGSRRRRRRRPGAVAVDRAPAAAARRCSATARPRGRAADAPAHERAAARDDVQPRRAIATSPAAGLAAALVATGAERAVAAGRGMGARARRRMRWRRRRGARRRDRGTGAQDGLRPHRRSSWDQRRAALPAAEARWGSVSGRDDAARVQTEGRHRSAATSTLV